jgi:hypothetical protein
MTLATFIKQNHSKIKTASKLHVRDLDQLSEFETVAYVDDVANSYDVKIVVNSRKNIVDTICDCEEGGVCKHIVALVLHISENKTEKKVLKKPRAKKLSETDTLLHSLDNENLRFWLSELLNTNKELAFLFKNHFGAKQVVFDTAFIKELVKESLQSVIGKRRKIETNEVKKFIDALTLSSKDLVEHLCFPPITPKKYELISFLIRELHIIDQNYYVTSNRIKRFTETILEDLIKNLYTIKDIDVWKQSVQFYFSLIFKENYFLHELAQCKKIYDYSSTNAIQQKLVVQVLENNLTLISEKSELPYFKFGIEIQEFILKIIIENDIFEKYASKFRPRLFENEFNIKLLDELMKIGHHDSVELYCEEIIARNYQEKFNIPYLKYLVTIYKATNDNKKLAKLYSVYGKFIYDIEVYLFIKENLTIDEFKKYRMAVFSYARSSYQSGDLEAFNFYFEIKKLDGKEQDLFDMLQNSSNLSFVNEYKEIAIGLNESNFFKLLFRFGYEYRNKTEDIESIINYIYNNVDKTKIQLYLKQFPSYSHSNMYLKISELVN